MIRGNRVLGTLLGIASSLGFGDSGRPELSTLDPASLPSPVRKKDGPRSINGRPKQRRCRNEARRIARWAERQRRRRARRMLRR